MAVRQWLPLAGIVLAVFVFNTSEFMPMALLTDIAADLGVSESSAGMVITAYAWAVALLSLPLMLLFRNADYRLLLIATVVVFVAFQTASALSSGYWMLVGARIGVACAHALFWSIASPLAVKVVPPEKRALALSAVVTGTSVAMVVGLPFGRAVGLLLGWRMTFAVVGAIALAAAVLLILVFPHVRSDGAFSLGDMRSILGNRVIMGIYAVTIFLVTGHYTAYSYIEPFLGQVSGLSETVITLLLAVFGAAGLLGSFMFARFYGVRPYRFIAWVMVLTTACLALLMPHTTSSSGNDGLLRQLPVGDDTHRSGGGDGGGHVPVLRTVQRGHRPGVAAGRHGGGHPVHSGHRVCGGGLPGRGLRLLLHPSVPRHAGEGRVRMTVMLCILCRVCGRMLPEGGRPRIRLCSGRHRCSPPRCPAL